MAIYQREATGLEGGGGTSKEKRQTQGQTPVKNVSRNTKIHIQEAHSVPKFIKKTPA